MKSKILGLLATGLLMGSVAASAVPVTITGYGASDGEWNVTTTACNRLDSACQAVLTAQVWFGNRNLAETFANEVWDALGYPNFPGGSGDFTPFFNFETPGPDVLGFGKNFENDFVQTWQGGADFTVWAVASRVSVPEPGTLALLGLGLAGLGLSRRRKAA